jgi:predicted nucleotide-binding protein
MRLARVVRVGSKDRVRGSGYLISERHVLTTNHLIERQEIGAPCQVTPLLQFDPEGERREIVYAATVVWRSPETDAALIEITSSASIIALPSDDVVRLGRVPADGSRWLCRGTGFPQAMNDAEYQLEGSLIRNISNARLDITVRSPLPKDLTGWAGFSGTAVFCGDLLVGIVRTVDSAWRDPLINAVPVDLFAETAEFRANLRRNGRPLTIEKLSQNPGVYAAPPGKRSVFIVHGHDDGTREAVARFLERIRFEAVILHERANKGRTIITKFREEAADIGFAVVLMTPDDHGGKATEPTNPRARQNVVFELGFFIGALGPERVAAIIRGDIERPSDFDGVVYIPFDAGNGWKQALGRELEAAGFTIDWNLVMRS